MNSIPDKLNTVLTSLCEQASNLLRAEAVSIWLREGDHLYLGATTSSAFEKIGGSIYYNLGEGLTGWVAAKGKPIRLTEDGLQSHSSWRGKWDSAMWGALRPNFTEIRQGDSWLSRSLMKDKSSEFFEQ